MSLAPALFVIQVRAARRTQAPAVAAANSLHRNREQYLFRQHVGEEQPITLVEADVGLKILEAFLFRPLKLGCRTIEQVEMPLHGFDNRLQASRTLQLDLRFQPAIDA